MVSARQSRDRQRRGWRQWYASRFSARAIVMTSLGGLLFLIYAIYAQSAHLSWYQDVAPPLAPLGLEHSSAAKVKPDVHALFSGSHDTHDDVVAKIAGPLLVDERLVLYPDERKAEAKISKVVNAARRDQAGFSRILVGCPSGCRNARVKRIGTLVVRKSSEVL